MRTSRAALSRTTTLTARGATAGEFFWLAAASMILLGLLAAAAVKLTPWRPHAPPAGA